MKTFRNILRALAAELTRPGAPFAVHDGRREPMKEHGVLYYLAPRERNYAPAPWFRRTLHAQRTLLDAQQFNHEAPTWDSYRVLALIHWQHFFWQAQSRSTSHLAPIAHDLLAELVDLIEQYDVVLATDIRSMRLRRDSMRADERAAHPGYVGFTDDVEFSTRFNAHLNLLLKNTSFLYHLKRTMVDSLDVAVALDERSKLIRCPAGVIHKKNESCDSCVATKWTRTNTTLIYIERLRDIKSIRIDSPKLYKSRDNTWHGEIRYWLDCLSSTEGVVRIDNPEGKYGQYLLVNHAKLARRAQDEQRKSPYVELFQQRPTDDIYVGAVARASAQEYLGNQVLARRRKPLRDYVTAAGWTWNDNTLDIPYELYSCTQLINKLDLSKKSVQYLLSNLPATKAKKPREASLSRQRRILLLEYQDEAGVKYPIQCFRAKKVRHDVASVYFTLPSTIEIPLKYQMAHNRVAIARSVAKLLYWNERGVHSISKEIEKPHVDHYLQWVIAKTKEITPAQFMELLYQNKFAERIGRVMREKETKPRINAGRFMPWEDKVINDYALGRGKCGPMTEWEWTTLLNTLPGRTKLGVRNRFIVLGRKYCKEHGWPAYANSGLCLNRSTRRRAAWTGRRKTGKTKGAL